MGGCRTLLHFIKYILLLLNETYRTFFIHPRIDKWHAAIAIDDKRRKRDRLITDILAAISQIKALNVNILHEKTHHEQELSVAIATLSNLEHQIKTTVPLGVNESFQKDLLQSNASLLERKIKYMLNTRKYVGLIETINNGRIEILTAQYATIFSMETDNPFVSADVFIKQITTQLNDIIANQIDINTVQIWGNLHIDNKAINFDNVVSNA